MLSRVTLRSISAMALVLCTAATLSNQASALPSRAVFAYSNGQTQLQVTVGSSTTVAATGRGWYESTGGDNGNGSSNNYIVGLCGSDACNDSNNDITNNFFVFTVPDAGTITAASLLLDVHANGSQPGYISTNPSETFTIYDVSTPPATLGTTTSTAIYTDLGSGTVYGSRAYTAADMGTTTTLTLNSAGVAFLNAHVGQTVAFGGSLGVTAPAPVPATPVPTLGVANEIALLLLVLAVGGVALALRRV